MPDTRDPGTGAGEFRFAAAPFAPDGGYSTSGLALIAILSIAAGVVVGAIVGWFAQWFYLVFIFPFGLGLLTGLGGGLGARVGKVRNVGLAFCIGALGGMAATATMHYVEFRTVLAEVQRKAPGAPVQATLGNFLDFVDARANLGVTIGGKAGQKGINLGYYGSYIYWILELILVMCCSGGVVVAAASAPFCTRCGTWKESKQLGRINAPREHALEAITSGDIIRLAGADVGAGPGRLSLHAAICANCQADAPIDIKFQEVVITDKGQESLKEIAHVTYPGDALPALEEIFANESRPALAAPEVKTLTAADEVMTDHDWEQFQLKPIEPKNAPPWILSVGPGELRLLDPQGALQAQVPFSASKERLVFPRFWGGVKNFGILADTGKVVWFENDKALMKEIQERIKV